MLTWFNALGMVKEPDNSRAIRQQPMWHNSSVTILGKSLASKEGIEKHVPLIDDFVDTCGNILTYQDFAIQNTGVQVSRISVVGCSDTETCLRSASAPRPPAHAQYALDDC